MLQPRLGALGGSVRQQVKFVKTPTGTGVAQGSLYVNPDTATANYTLQGWAVGGVERLRLSSNGHLMMRGGLYLNSVVNGRIHGNTHATDGQLTLLGTGTTTPALAGAILLSGLGAGDHGVQVWGASPNLDTLPGPIKLSGGSAWASATGANRNGGNLTLQAGLLSGAGADGSIILYDANGSTKRMEVDGSGIGFFAATPVGQRLKANYNNWAAFGDVVDALVALGLFDAA